MNKILSTVVFFLMSCPVLAAVNEMDAKSAPPETVSMVYVVLFGVLFVGIVAGFFIYLWWSTKDKSDQ